MIHMNHACRRPQVALSRASWVLVDPSTTSHHHHARDNTPGAASEPIGVAGTSDHAGRRESPAHAMHAMHATCDGMASGRRPRACIGSHIDPRAGAGWASAG